MPVGSGRRADLLIPRADMQAVAREREQPVEQARLAVALRSDNRLGGADHPHLLPNLTPVARSNQQITLSRVHRIILQWWCPSITLARTGDESIQRSWGRSGWRKQVFGTGDRHVRAIS